MSEIAKAYVQIIPSAQGMRGRITDELSGEASSAGSSAGFSIAGAIKKAIAAAGIGMALKATITEGAELQQSIGGIETLYKDSADKMKEYASQAYQTSGVSANEYMTKVTSFSASLLQSLGGDTSKAADSANSAMIDMSDNANKMGTNMEDIQNAYQGFAKQNYTMLDNLKLGYGGTKTEMQRLLADAQKISGVKYDIANLNDVYSAIHVIQGELDITGTTAKEASSTLSGSFGSMKAAAKDFLGNLTLGQDIAPSLNALANTTTTFLFGNLLPALGNIFSALPGAIVTFISAAAPQMITAASGMLSSLATGLSTNVPELISSALTLLNNLKLNIYSSLPTILQAGTETINSFVTGMLNDIPNLLSGMGAIITNLLDCILAALPQTNKFGFDIIQNLVNGILSNLPAIITSIGTTVALMLDMLMDALPEMLSTGVQMIMQLASGILSNIPAILSSISDVLGNLLSTIAAHIPEFLQTGIELIGEMAAGLIQAIPQIIGAIPQIVGAIFDTLGAVDWLELGGNIIKGIADGVANAGKAIMDAVLNAAKGALDAVKEFFGIKSPSRLMRDEVGKFIPAGIAVGIEGNVSPIKTAMEDIATLTTDSANVNIAKSLSYSTPDVATTQTDSVGDKMDYIIRMMAKYLPSCAEKTVIDGKSLVNGIDKQLGLAVL